MNKIKALIILLLSVLLLMLSTTFPVRPFTIYTVLNFAMKVLGYGMMFAGIRSLMMK